MSGAPDIVIVGAGPVGLATAAALAQTLPAGRGRIHLIDAGPAPAAPAADAPWDLRVFAASRASQRLLTNLGAWAQIPPTRRQPYAAMEVWDEAASLGFDAADLGATDLGHIVENDWIRAAIFAEIERIGRINLEFSTRVKSVHFADERYAIATDNGQIWTPALLIAADGAGSPTRSLLGLGAGVIDHQASALVCHLACETPHGAVARQRFLETGPLALLPLADGRVSLVWSSTTDAVAAMLAMDDAAFSEHVSEASRFVLGSLRATTERLSFPLRSLTAESPAHPGLVLIGDAAHTVHPLAGQGMNLGLLDAAALAEVVVAAIAEGESPGSLRTLRRFHRRRDQHNRMMQLAFAALDRSFRARSFPAAALRRAGLAIVAATPALRRMFMRRAVGIEGDVPALMRPQH